MAAKKAKRNVKQKAMRKTHVEKLNAADHTGPHVRMLVHPFEAYDEMAVWERVWTEAVALAWRDWDKTGGFRDRLLADAREAVLEEFGFNFPEDCKLKVVQGREDAWQYDDAENVWRHPHAATRLTLTLPFRPKNPEIRPIALANYVATGQSMPFTCCCCC